MPSPHKAMGGFTLTLEHGAVVLERELRRCAHCGVLWVAGLEYRGSDGKPVERGFCRTHMAPTCGSPGCVQFCVDVDQAGTVHVDHRRDASNALIPARELPPMVTCGHCRRPYQPVPGSGTRREWCKIHNGPLCGQCEVGCGGH